MSDEKETVDSNDFESYEDYLKHSEDENSTDNNIVDDMSSVSDNVSSTDISDSTNSSGSTRKPSSYMDYLMGGNSESDDNPVEGDQLLTNTGDEDTASIEGVFDDNSGQDALFSSVEETGDAVESEVSGGLFDTIRNGISDSIGGAFGSIFNGLRGIGNAFTGKAQNVADTFHMPLKAVFALAGFLSGGSIITLIMLLAGGQSVVKYSDYGNCNNLTMIDEYVAKHGAGDDWTEDSARGAAREIYTGLASSSPWTFETKMWDGSQWVLNNKTNEGFGFSDEAIAGMLSNAWAESKIRADCFEMDYKVHDIHKKDDAGNYIYHVGDAGDGDAATSDFILGRTHHSNWDAYVERMFELYEASGESIDEDTYKWKANDTGKGSLNNVANDLGIVVHSDTSNREGLYPGIGLWQWTGQRAYNMAQFADLRPDPVDENQDSVNDELYTTKLQLGFLYYEDWGDFRPYGATAEGVLAWGRQNTFGYPYRITNCSSVHNALDSGVAYKTLSYSTTDDSGDVNGYLGSEEGKDIDMTQDIFGGQKESDLNNNRDVWSRANGDQTTIRWPKVALECPGFVLGEGDETYVSSSYLTNVSTGQSSSGWTARPLSDYIGNGGPGSDNVCSRIFSVDEAEYNAGHPSWSGSEKIRLARRKREDGSLMPDKKDKGYWAITSDSDMQGGETIYKSAYQSMKKTNGSRTRKNSVIRTGREFNENECNKIVDLYKFKHDYWREQRSYTTTENGEEKTVYYYVYFRRTSLLPKDRNEVRSVHNQMMDPEGKYIVADLTLSSGAESATECALQFWNKWEGMESCHDVAKIKAHLQKAGSFYILMHTDGWEANDEYAHSILETVNINRTNHDLVSLWETYFEMGCDKVLHAPDGIAACAVAWAWPKGTDFYDLNYPNRSGGCYTCSASTSLYAAVRDQVIPGDGWYSSCDRGVCTAVRAAGADDNIPVGNASGIYQYALTNPDKWENLGPIRSVGALDQLEPGDLLLAGVPGGGSGGHVVVFVGPDLVQEKWPGGAGEVHDGKYAVVHASHSSGTPGIKSRGPRCDNDCQWLLSDSRVFYGFRCKQYEDSSEYKDLVKPLFEAGYADGTDGSGAHYTPANI